MLRLTPNTRLPPTPDTLDTPPLMVLAILATHTLLPMDMEIVPMLDLDMETLAILGMLVLDSATLGLDSAMLLLDSGLEVTMARGRLMLSPKFLLVTPTLVMVLAILVIPTLVPLPMDMVTLAMLDLAMLVLDSATLGLDSAMLLLDSATDTPTLLPLEPAETILELLSHAKHELYLTFMTPCLLPFVFNKKSITLF